ncbi:hypothetical protein [Phage f2b1]|nr:hypothetical protein [Phage f2b1]
MQRLYKITLTNGVERVLTRNEPDGKSIIGLWIWAQKRHLLDVILDFNECVVNASHVMMIDRPEDIVYDDPDTPIEEEDDVQEYEDLPEEIKAKYPYYAAWKESLREEE